MWEGWCLTDERCGWEDRKLIMINRSFYWGIYSHLFEGPCLTKNLGGGAWFPITVPMPSTHICGGGRGESISILHLHLMRALQLPWQQRDGAGETPPSIARKLILAQPTPHIYSSAFSGTEGGDYWLGRIEPFETTWTWEQKKHHMEGRHGVEVLMVSPTQAEEGSKWINYNF